MNIVRCPRCLDDVTVPLRASPKALVRCPLCLEEYLLREALGGLPPELVVLDGSDAVDEPALVGAGAAEIEVGGSDDYRVSGGAFDAALDSSAPGRAVAAPRPVVKGARPARREKNAVVEVLKIVLGGLVGLTLGYFVLLWGFSMDVLDLGPKMAPYAPWIVPAKFRGAPSQTTTASVDTSGDSTPSGGQAPNGATGNGKRTQPREPQAMEPVNDGVARSSASEPTSVADPAAADGGLGGITVEPGIKPIPLPEPYLGPLLPVVNPKLAGNGKPEPETNPKSEPKLNPATKPEPKPESKPLPTADDLTMAALAASESYTKVNEAAGQPPEVRRQLFIDFYSAASDAGRIISQLDAASPELSEQVTTLKDALSGLAAQPGKVSALKSLTDLNLPKRKHEEGVLLAGVVQEFAPAGTLFACKFQAGKSLAETTVLSAANPEESYKAGDELLLVGRVVEDPVKNLPGYEGDATRVVLLGYAVAVPKAETAPNP